MPSQPSKFGLYRGYGYILLRIYLQIFMHIFLQAAFGQSPASATGRFC